MQFTSILITKMDKTSWTVLFVYTKYLLLAFIPRKRGAFKGNLGLYNMTQHHLQISTAKFSVRMFGFVFKLTHVLLEGVSQCKFESKTIRYFLWPVLSFRGYINNQNIRPLCKDVYKVSGQLTSGNLNIRQLGSALFDIRQNAVQLDGYWISSQIPLTVIRLSG